MWSKLVVFVAAVCVANGSVITINVFDDEPQTAVRQGVADCNFRACEQLCRRLGFPGGACVNGRCDCDNFRDAKELGTFIADSSSDRYTFCQDQICNDNCVKKGDRRGVCIYNHCICIKKTYAEELDTIIKELAVKNSNCQDQTCDDDCKKAGGSGGVCIDNQCKCVEEYAAELDTIIEELAVKNSNCQDQTCDDNCKKAGGSGGVCIDNQCKCVKKYAADLVSHGKKITSCGSITCKEQCQKISFPNGICIFDYCKCINDYDRDILTDVSHSALDTPTSKLTCTKMICNTVCRMLHFKSGSCVNGACKCNKNDAVTVSEESHPDASSVQQTVADYAESKEGYTIFTEDEESDEQSEDIFSCNPYKCIKKCVISGKHGGFCRHHKCHCI